jgi:hypothetical protein
MEVDIHIYCSRLGSAFADYNAGGKPLENPETPLPLPIQ